MSILLGSGDDGRFTSICDVCRESTITGTRDDSSDRDFLKAAGWRWYPVRDPLDTCPDCLKAGA